MKEFPGIRRLNNYDYSQPGAYFITICANERDFIFGEILNGVMILNPAGEMIENEWLLLPERYSQLVLDESMVMPNHFHAIVWINYREENGISVGAPLVGASVEERGDEPRAYEAISLPSVIGAFKSITTNQYIKGVKMSGWPAFNRKLWQQNYYEHVIRDEIDLDRIRKYITGNPVLWDNDEENPSRRGKR